MDTSYIIYSFAVAWFTYHMFWMAMRIYQFQAFPKTYGQHPCLSLDDLAEAASAQDRDIPAFKVIVPAYLETDVIEGTLYRLTSLNYPRTYYEVHVVTYEDEPITVTGESTTQVVRRVAKAINAKAGIQMLHSIVTPRGYDGFFPGNLTANEQHIGKARGLNYALRQIHENNEQDERSYFIGKMSRSGYLHQADNVLSEFQSASNDKTQLVTFVERYFAPNSCHYIGALTCSPQLKHLVKITQQAADSGNIDKDSWGIMADYIQSEAPRFFFQLTKNSQTAGEFPKLVLNQFEDKAFLYSVMLSVEALALTELEQYSLQREKVLEQSRPTLFRKLSQPNNGEGIFQLARKFNSRWVLVYDADADAPLDIMRHLAGRILTEPDVMGFQGPIAPLLNYDSVHPLCRMGALWMAFWHASAYPRLLNSKAWAHPLAGTNWCFRIEGFEHKKQLIRHCSYDETRRKFLLTFDPRNLTEDLETGIRNFSEWSVNAAWHPIVEMEQVPPTPSAMFRQHTRWSLGTLQTMKYILNSRLPFLQKTWFAIYPLRVLFASSGPFITGGLIIAFYMDLLIVEPIFAWWTLFLAFGNFIYIWAFIKTFERYYDFHQQYSAVNFLYKNRTKLADDLAANHISLTPADADKLKQTLQSIENGMKPSGFVTRFFHSRYTDSINSTSSDNELNAYIAELIKATPFTIQPELFADFAVKFKEKLASIPIANTGKEKPLSPELTKMVELVDKASHRAGVDKTFRWSRYHTQILIWAIPFVYFSVTPFFKAFWLWAKGDKTPWSKTVRTVKSKMRTTGLKPPQFKSNSNR